MTARFLSAVALGLFLLSCPSLLASPARQGCTEAQVSVLLDVRDSHQEDRPILSGALGYYLLDWLQIGAKVTYESVEADSAWGYGAVWGLGGFAEAEWRRWKCMVTPYVSAGLQFYSENESGTVTVLTVSPGLKWFLTQTIGVAAQANLDYASREIYDYDPATDSADQFDVSALLALRFLFF
jgi:hypothetical protein